MLGHTFVVCVCVCACARARVFIAEKSKRFEYKQYSDNSAFGVILCCLFSFV